MLTTCRRLPRRVALFTILSATAVVATVMTSGPATADPLASEQAQASKLQRQVTVLDQKWSAASERYRSNLAKLEDLKAQTIQASANLEIARKSEQQATQQFMDRMVAAYTSGAGRDLIPLATSDSVSGYFDRKEAIERVEAADAAIVAELRAAQIRVAAKKKELDSLKQQQDETVLAVAKELKSAQLQLHRKQRLLANTQASVRRLLAQKQAAEAAAAAARSRAAAAALASLNAPPSIAPSFDPSSALGMSGGALPSSGSGSAAVAVAMRYLGTPYVWGGSSPAGFDCSGLTMYAYAQVGVSIPRTTYTQWNAGPHVSREDLQPGDLVFFDGLGHMGMYVGGGNMIHAPHTGDVVRIASLNSSWYASSYMGAVRIG